jgi:hypothetical protein
MAAGPSVYRARSMYALINDTVVYQDSAVCAFEGYFRESSNVLYPNINDVKNKAALFQVYPNPAQQNVSFNINNTALNGTIYIYNMSGIQIDHFAIKQGNNKINYDISKFANGIYVAHFINH